MIRQRTRAFGDLLWLAAVSLVAGCGIERAANDTIESAITNGMVDSGDPAVVALVSDGRAFCSGTLVSPRVVVTAAHCIGRRQVSVLFGTSGAAIETLRDVVDQRAHPSFEAIGLRHDIGVLLLGEPAPSSVTPAAMRLRALPDSVIGGPVRIVGFGTTSPQSTADSGRKRAATATVSALDALSFVFSGESQTCMGDSGGPAFMTFDGVEQLVGVHSAGDSRCEQYGRDTRVDGYATDFVMPYIEATSAVGLRTGERCFLADNCASGMCEPSADAPTIRHCTSPCASNGDCPGAMRCDVQSSVCRYPMPSPGAFATACAADADCDSRMCARPEGHGDAMCTVQCLAEIPQTCPVDSVCVTESRDSKAFVCAPQATAGGCAIGARAGEPPFAALLLGLLAVARACRRRVPAPR